MKILCLRLGIGVIITALSGCKSMPLNPTTVERVSVHGHRGSRGTHPENTFPAFEEAVSAGVQVLELDLQLTADDVPVVTHDPDISERLCRYTSGKPLSAPIPIRSLQAADLAQFECGNVAQSRFPDQKLIAGLKIPTFDAFLQWWKTKAPRLELNVETKMSAEDAKWIPDPDIFAHKVVGLLRQYGAVEKTILQSFDFRTLQSAKKLEYGLRLSCLFDDERGFCEPTAAIGAHIASPKLTLVTASEVEQCHLKKIQVVPWTANEPGEWQELLSKGVDGIITDYPRKLVTYLSGIRAEKKKR